MAGGVDGKEDGLQGRGSNREADEGTVTGCKGGATKREADEGDGDGLQGRGYKKGSGVNGKDDGPITTRMSHCFLHAQGSPLAARGLAVQRR